MNNNMMNMNMNMINMMNNNMNNNMMNNNIMNNDMMNMNMMNNNILNIISKNNNIFNMMSNNNMISNNSNMNAKEIQENITALLSIIKKMQSLQYNMVSQININNSLEKLLNLLNINIIVMDCIGESRNIIENNRFLMANIIDNLSKNNVQDVNNNIQNKDFVYICLNNKIKKYLEDNSRGNDNNTLISQCSFKFFKHKNEYEHCVSALINSNITMNNDGSIYNAILEDTNGSLFTLVCKTNEKLSDLFMRYKIVKGCTDKNYSFLYNMKRLNPEINIIESGLFGSGYSSGKIKVV